MTYYWFVFAVLTALVLYFNFKYNMLRDDSTLKVNKSYSYARTQLAFWTVIVFSGYGAIILKYNIIPDLSDGVLYLLGISSATTIAARISDNSDKDLANSDENLQNTESKNFILDILSDKKGVSIHRLQAVLFNIAIGFWFIKRSIFIVNHPDLANCYIDPDISMNNLILMGLSAGTYVTLKTSENKSSTTSNPVLSTGKSDEKNEHEIPPVG
jgi:hypothetical protein